MERVRRYADEMRAEQAVVALRAHGIGATVVGHHTQPLISMGKIDNPWVGFDVVVGRGDRERAEEVLREHDATVAEFEEGWEEEASRVALRELDAEVYGVSCPGCGEWLGLETDLERCPGCGEDVDVVELVVTVHGPEVLEGVESASVVRLERMRRDVTRCAECGGDLDGLGLRGRCPGCGRLFDKDEMHGGRV